MMCSMASMNVGFKISFQCKSDTTKSAWVNHLLRDIGVIMFLMEGKREL